MNTNHTFHPNWNQKPPPQGTYRSIFKWGAPETFKHPTPGLFSLLKEKLGMTNADFAKRKSEGLETVHINRPIKISMDHLNRFKDITGSENVFSDDFSRVKYSHGKTMEEALKLRARVADEIPDVVLHPRDRNDVQKIVAYCHEQRLPLYVYGGGSSVNFGFKATNGGVTLVMNTYMNRVLDFNEIDQTITVEPGIFGPAYEDILNHAPAHFSAQRPHTGGHFPQSFEYSTVGGWIVTLGSGQASTYYGDMYDIVLSQEYVTPAGSFRTLAYPATATGPKINDMMKGSEGAFGVLVAATLKIFRHLPKNRQRFAFMFPTWNDCVDAAREISQGEFGMPSVFRISDPEETDIAMNLYGIKDSLIDRMISWRNFKPMQRCLLIGTSDGEKGFARHIKRRIKKISRRFGAMYISGFPVKKWEHGRFTDPYLREDLNDYGVIIDTLETAVTWDRLHKVHQEVRTFIKKRPRTICMAHSSHFYPQGTNLYFIFIAKMNAVEEYTQFQTGIIDQIANSGGSLSHHHGIGKMIAPWMEGHLGKVQMGALHALKNYFDPNRILNPGGTLGLERSKNDGMSI
jgi:alkyldihydroxyacetonephosphate synthase